MGEQREGAIYVRLYGRGLQNGLSVTTDSYTRHQHGNAFIKLHHSQRRRGTVTHY